MIDDYKISKILSSNDTGENGTHQSGILIPKEDKILNFFPVLNSEIKNPRMIIGFTDASGKVWKFNFIYYNNKFFEGTRNEYRLTGTTEYVKENGLKTGDGIIFSKDSSDLYFISYMKMNKTSEKQKENCNVLKLGNKWRVISF